jgi:hypothetical protein
MARNTRIAAALVIGAGALALAGCSSASDAASAPASAIAAASSAAAAAGSADAAGAGGATAAGMPALCAQMVAAGMSPEEADALAVSKGYVTRVGSIDGQPQAVTMDINELRFTFDVKNGAVTACTFG